MEFQILLGVVLALISLVGVVVVVFMKRRPVPTQVTLQCQAHPTFESKLQTMEIKVNGLENKIAGLSAHITSIENKIDNLKNSIDTLVSR